MKWELMYIAGLGVGFGALALYLGYDSIVLGAVFGLLGTIGGYIAGKKSEKEA